MIEHQQSIWALSPEAKKQRLVSKIRIVLRRDKLSDLLKYLIVEALGHMWAGRYELAFDCVDDIYDPPDIDAFDDEIAHLSKSLSRLALVRELRHVAAFPARTHPVFG